jgi:hypothetical protein
LECRFRRAAEGKIRQKFIEDNLLPAVILIFDKGKTLGRKRKTTYKNSDSEKYLK